MPVDAEPPEPPVPDGQVLIYRDGAIRLRVRLQGRSVWLTQALIAELFQTTKAKRELAPASRLQPGGAGARISCQGILDNCRRRQALPHVPLQPRRHPRRRLPRPLGAGHRVPPMGHRPPVRPAGEGLHARRRAPEGKAAPSAPTTSTNCSSGSATSALPSGSPIRRSPTFKPPAWTTTRRIH